MCGTCLKPGRQSVRNQCMGDQRGQGFGDVTARKLASSWRQSRLHALLVAFYLAWVALAYVSMMEASRSHLDLVPGTVMLWCNNIEHSDDGCQQCMLGGEALTGKPTGLTLLGGTPEEVIHADKPVWLLLVVATWTSMPITGSFTCSQPQLYIL